MSTYQRRDAEAMLSALFNDAWDVMSKDSLVDDQANERSTWVEERDGDQVETLDPVARQRRATVDKSKSNSHWAMKIDMDRAWKFTELTTQERWVLELRYGKQWSVKAIAECLNFTRGGVDQILLCAVGALVDELNYGTNRKARKAEADRKRELNRLYQRAFR